MRVRIAYTTTVGDDYRQIWISPYVKGSEDLPLVIKPRRALVWTR